MDLAVQYRGLAEGALVLTPEGRYATTFAASAAEPAVSPAMKLYEESRQMNPRLAMLQAEQARVLAEVYRRAGELAGRLRALSLPREGASPRQARAALSSQPQALAATASPGATAPARYGLAVTLPASGRRVLSKLRNPVAAVTELSGEQGFLLTVAGEAHQLSVEVAPGGTPSTQEEFLKRLARAIGGADARIKAEVVYEFVDARDPAARSRPMNRVVRLQIASASGGEGVDFSLEDAAGSRLVAAYGLDKGSPRHGALLEVGGNELRQAEDQVSLDQGRVTATALAATHGEARVAVEEGLATLKGELEQVFRSTTSWWLSGPAGRPPAPFPQGPHHPSPGGGPGCGQAGPARQRGRPPDRGPGFGAAIEAEYDYAGLVLWGAGGWATALARKLDQVLAADPAGFAAELLPQSPFEARQQAWDLLQQLGKGIINGYA